MSLRSAGAFSGDLLQAVKRQKISTIPVTKRILLLKKQAFTKLTRQTVLAVTVHLHEV